MTSSMSAHGIVFSVGMELENIAFGVGNRQGGCWGETETSGALMPVAKISQLAAGLMISGQDTALRIGHGVRQKSRFAVFSWANMRELEAGTRYCALG